jgi:hypothetical protein
MAKPIGFSADKFQDKLQFRAAEAPHLQALLFFRQSQPFIPGIFTGN